MHTERSDAATISRIREGPEWTRDNTEAAFVMHASLGTAREMASRNCLAAPRRYRWPVYRKNFQPCPRTSTRLSRRRPASSYPSCIHSLIVLIDESPGAGSSRIFQGYTTYATPRKDARIFLSLLYLLVDRFNRRKLRWLICCGYFVTILLTRRQGKTRASLYPSYIHSLTVLIAQSPSD